MPGNELTVQDLLAALEKIRGWAAAVRSALATADAEAVVAHVGDRKITNGHLIATQTIIENWVESVRKALERVENPETIRFPVIAGGLNVDFGSPRPGTGCIGPDPLVSGQCGVRLLIFPWVDIESS